MGMILVGKERLLLFILILLIVYMVILGAKICYLSSWLLGPYFFPFTPFLHQIMI